MTTATIKRNVERKLHVRLDTPATLRAWYLAQARRWLKDACGPRYYRNRRRRCLSQAFLLFLGAVGGPELYLHHQPRIDRLGGWN